MRKVVECRGGLLNVVECCGRSCEIVKKSRESWGELRNLLGGCVKLWKVVIGCGKLKMFFGNEVHCWRLW